MTMLDSNDGSIHRYQRLEKTFRLAREIIAISEAQASLLIHTIYDHKGSLTVTWNAEPTARQRDAFACAWEMVGESGANITHAVAVPGLEWNL